MSIEDRNYNLDVLLDIVEPEVQVIEEKSIQIMPQGTEIVQAEQEHSPTVEQTKKLDELFEMSKSVLDSAAEQATSFGKSRDTEAYAKLLDSMVNIQKTISEIRVAEPVKAKKDDTINNTQNNFFVGNFRELLDEIKKEGTI